MITKEEFLEWRESIVTKKVIELLHMGSKSAVEDLISARGEIGDVARGAHLAYEDVIELVTTGIGIFEEKE